MKLCKDCKWCAPMTTGKFDSFASCERPDLREVHCVSGEETSPSCLMVRADARCGSEGSRWEPRV